MQCFHWEADPPRLAVGTIITIIVIITVGITIITGAITTTGVTTSITGDATIIIIGVTTTTGVTMFITGDATIIGVTIKSLPLTTGTTNGAVRHHLSGCFFYGVGEKTVFLRGIQGRTGKI